MARDIESLLRQQATLAAFGSFAFQEMDLVKILQEAARLCAASLGVVHCKVCRYRPEQNDLLIEAGFGWKPGVVGKVVSPVDESSPQGRAFLAGEPVIVPNLWEASDYTPPDFYKNHGIVSTVDVLIKTRTGPPFGVLEVDSTTEHTYDGHDIDVLTGFANVLAEAVATSARTEVMRTTLTRMTAMVAEKDLLLEERNFLAMELQHRVRNNLQLINDMVTTQLRQTADVPVRKGLQGIIRQIMTLAEVYEHLLGIGMNGKIDLGAYVTALCANLADLQPPSGFPIALHCVAEPLRVSLATATALGSVLTELISNAYEHAFPGRGGNITIGGKSTDRSGYAEITIADDGVGYVSAAETRRHGVGLVRRLMSQVEGTLEVTGGAGTVWTLRFPVITAANLAPEIA
jgi:two-component sensor histidine kinase